MEPVPFIFPPAVNSNIFGGVTGDERRAGMVRHIVADQDGKPYSYYQDEAQPHQVYYLPDSFKIARSNKAPYLPAMRISVNNPDSIATSDG